MKLAIMQPYLLPYIGYFQLIGAVDRFVVYDNIKYTKKGWINRNRMLVNGEASAFTVSLRHDSDSLDICDRRVAADFDRVRLLNQVRGAYRKAPHFDKTYALLELVFGFESDNLFDFLHHGLTWTCRHLSIATPIVASSQVPVDHRQRGERRVIAICLGLGATNYINPNGGIELYSAPAFAEHGISLSFLRSRPLQYAQFGRPFVPSLSILDVMMFNPVATIRQWLATHFDLVTAPSVGVRQEAGA
ncbi:MAG: WbqC family protein [Burkholderiaceae bacterium]|nr:WbqC family protein [Burkholderiaceae bacterium]